MRPSRRILVLLGIGATFIASELLVFRSLNTSIEKLANGTVIVMQKAVSLSTIASASSKLLNISAEEPAPCTFGSLPQNIQNLLKGETATWKVQEPENLGEYTRKTWAGKKPPGCPGIAVGLFQNAKAPSYAVLLVPVPHPERSRPGFSETCLGFRLLVFSRKVGLSTYEATVVEKSNDTIPSSYFIRKAPVSRFFNEDSKRKFQVQATEAILMVDSAEQEYEADIYFWSNGGFRREPVDD